MLVATWTGRGKTSKLGQKQRTKWIRSLLGRRYVMDILLRSSFHRFCLYQIMKYLLLLLVSTFLAIGLMAAYSIQNARIHDAQTSGNRWEAQWLFRISC